MHERLTLHFPMTIAHIPTRAQYTRISFISLVLASQVFARSRWMNKKRIRFPKVFCCTHKTDKSSDALVPFCIEQFSMEFTFPHAKRMRKRFEIQQKKRINGTQHSFFSFFPCLVLLTNYKLSTGISVGAYSPTFRCACATHFAIKCGKVNVKIIDTKHVFPLLSPSLSLKF